MKFNYSSSSRATNGVVGIAFVDSIGVKGLQRCRINKEFGSFFYPPSCGSEAYNDVRIA